jgi:hypothetical protein
MKCRSITHAYYYFTLSIISLLSTHCYANDELSPLQTFPS